MISPCANLEAFHKQEVKAKAELPTAWLSVEDVFYPFTQNQYAQKHLAKTGRMIHLGI